MAGAALRTVALLLRFLQFCLALTCMGIFSYFIAVLHHFNLHVLIKWRLVEAFTVLATIYALLAILLVLCLAGSKIFGFIAIFFDIFFIGCFIAVAWLTRHGAYQCNGLVQTPVGDGLSQYGAFGITNTSNYVPRLGTACRLNRAVFALAIILIFLFLATAILQLLMSRSKKDKRYASNEKDYNNTTRSSKTPIWQRNRGTKTRSRSSSRSRRRSHREKDLAVAGAGAGVGATAARGLSGRRSGDSGSTLDDGTYGRHHKHHESGLDRPGHTPITGRGTHATRPGEDVTYLARGDGTYLARDDGTHTIRNGPNDPIHSVTVHSPTTTTTTTTHLPPNPVVGRDSSRGRRGVPGYAQEDGRGNTHVPGFNQPMTQHTPYHEITTGLDRSREEEAIIRNQNAPLGQSGYNQNIAPGQPGYGQNIVGGQREYDNRRSGDYGRRDITPGRDTNILPGQTGHGLNTVGNQREYDNRGQAGYDQNIVPGQTGYGQNVVGNQRDYDNRRSGEYGRRDITPGRDTTLGRDRDITPGRVRDITPGRTSNRNTITNSRDYDNTNLGQTDYGRDNTLGRDRDITPGRDGYTRNTIANQRDYDNTGRGQTGYNTNQGYNDNFDNRDPSFNRTPSAGRVRRF